MGKFLFWTCRWWEIRSSFDSKSWCKMIFSLAWNTMFSEFGKVLVLNFSEIGNTFFFYLKSWWKVDIFLVFLNFLWTFQRWEIRCSFDSKSWCKIIFFSALNTMFSKYGKVLVLNFSEIGNTFFFYLKSWWKVDIFLVFLNFLWYSRTWEIWFFVQC